MSAPHRALRVAYSDHLVASIAEAHTAAGRIAAVPVAVRQAAAAGALRRTARASARLDASPLEDETADAVDAGGRTPVSAAVVTSAGGWAAALRLEELATQDVAAIEYRNLLAVGAAEPALAARILDDPLPTLAILHGLVAQGLVEPGVVGRPRRTTQAVHDGAQGMVVYNPVDPDLVPGLMEDLGAWVQRSALVPAIVVAGVVHEKILEWHPFEAANGRVARAAARLLLRARGLDPDGLLVVDEELARDVTGYFGEVAATVRRRGDLLLWSERWADAVAAAALAAADALAPLPVGEVPERALGVLDALAPGGMLSLRDYAQAAGTTPEQTRADLAALAAAGRIRAEPGSRGLRWRLPTAGPIGPAGPTGR